MGLSKVRDYYVYLVHVYRAGKWVYLVGASETPPISRQNLTALWKVQGTTSIEQAKSAVQYYTAFTPPGSEWAGLVVDRIL